MRLALLCLLAAEPASAQSLAVRRVAVLQFETAHIGASGMVASDQFSMFLQKDYPGRSVVERTRLQRVLAEQQLQVASGLVDPETAARLKNLLGVDSLVIGSIVAMDIAAVGGEGTLMMTARLVDTSSGRILWAETRTVDVRARLLKRALRGFSSAAPVSDHLVASRLIEKAAQELVRDLGGHLGRDALETDHVEAALALKRAQPRPTADDACSGAKAEITRLGESILPDEALFWAARLKAAESLDTVPGSGYPDEELRRRLTTKIMFWLGERDLPRLGATAVARIASVKKEMTGIYRRCLPTHPEFARFIGPPSPRPAR